MSQASLFDDPHRPLLDDALGRVSYTAGWLDAAQAQDWFEQLTQQVQWRHQRRLMYQRELDVPRLQAHYALRDPALPEPLRAAARLLQGSVEASFNSVGLNLYRDQHDSVAPHNDRLVELVEGAPIALLSLGATREMVIRAKRSPRLQLTIGLAPGSLLLMDYASQLHYDHGIPKQRAPVSARISLAFRARRALAG